MNAIESERRTDLFYAGELPVDDLFDVIWKEEQTNVRYPAMSPNSQLYDGHCRDLSSESTYLTPDEELECAASIQIGKSASRRLDSSDSLDEDTRNTLLLQKQDGIDARAKLVLTNIRFAGWIVRESMDFNKKRREETGKTSYRGRIVRDIWRFSGGEMDYDDRLQVVTEALVKAADNYTGLSKKGSPVSFPSWALMRMEATLIRANNVQAGQSPVTMGPGVMDRLNHYRKVKRELEADKDRDAKIYELADKLEVHPQRVLESMEDDIANQSISFEVVQDYLGRKFADDVAVLELDEDDSLTLEDTLIDGGADLSVEEEALEKIFGEDVDKILSGLSEREQRIIELRYGFEDGNTWTLEEVGREFGVTRERIRQIEAAVIKKMRTQIISYSLRHHGWASVAIGDVWLENSVFGTQVGSRRPILAIDEADDVRLGIKRSRPYNNRELNGVREDDREEEIAGATKSYSVEEFQQMRQND